MADLSLSSHFTSLSDNLIDLLEVAGDNIADLDLYAVDQIDVKAIAMISIYCKQLGNTLFPLLLYFNFLEMFCNFFGCFLILFMWPPCRVFRPKVKIYSYLQ